MPNSLLLCIDSTELFAFDISQVNAVEFLGSWTVFEIANSASLLIESEFEKLNSRLQSHFGAKSKNISTVLGLDATQFIAQPTPEIENNDPFQLEQILPVDAENIAVRQNEWVSVIAIRNRIQPLVDAILQLGIVDLISILPTDLLLASCGTGASLPSEELETSKQLVPGANTSTTESNENTESRILWQPNRDSDPSMVQLDSGTITGWSSKIDCRKDFAGSDWPFHDQLQTAVNSKGWKPNRQWFNFLNDFTTVAKEREQAAAGMVWIAALLLLLSLAGALALRASSLESQSIQIDNNTYNAFRKSLPEFAKSRLYERKLKAVVTQEQEIGDWIGANLATEQILIGLYEVLDSLPEQTDFRITSIKLDRDQIELEGNVTEISSLEAVKEALRKNKNLVLADGSYGLGFRLEIEFSGEGSRP